MLVVIRFADNDTFNEWQDYRVSNKRGEAMTKKRDYRKEILDYLENHKVDGHSLQVALKIDPSRIYGILLELEDAGEIKLVLSGAVPFDCYWERR